MIDVSRRLSISGSEVTQQLHLRYIQGLAPHVLQMRLYKRSVAKRTNPPVTPSATGHSRCTGEGDEIIHLRRGNRPTIQWRTPSANLPIAQIHCPPDTHRSVLHNDLINSDEVIND